MLHAFFPDFKGVGELIRVLRTSLNSDIGIPRHVGIYRKRYCTGVLKFVLHSNKVLEYYRAIRKQLTTNKNSLSTAVKGLNMAVQ